MVSRRLGPALNRIGARSTPSIVRSEGIGAPARLRQVLNKSIEQASSWVVTAGLIFPGHQAMPGSRIPPSQALPLPSNKGPAEPPTSPLFSQGPLSLVKKTKVFPASFSRRSVSNTLPTLQSSSSTTSPYSPRGLVPLNFVEANNGTC